MTVRLEGFSELARELEGLASPAARKASARRALRKAAEPIADDARSRAPVGETERLALSVSVGTKLSARQTKLHRKMFSSDRASVEMFIGAGPLASAHTQEFGTRHHPAQPFLRPAWDQGSGKMLDDLKKELWADIQASIARAERRAARLAARGQ